MPEIGGSKLASDFGSMMAGVRKSIDASKQVVEQAVTELKTEIEAGALAAAKAIRTEAATVRAGYAELLGNNPPQVEVQPNPPAGKAADPVVTLPQATILPPVVLKDTGT